MSGSIVSSFIQFVFIKRQVEGYRNVLKLISRALAITSSNIFIKKNKKRSGTSLPTAFCA